MSTWRIMLEALSAFWVSMVQKAESMLGGDPTTFNAPIWNTTISIADAIRAIAIPLCVIFFLWSLFRYTTNLREITLHNITGNLLRLVVAIGAAVASTTIVTLILKISGDMVGVVIRDIPSAELLLDMPETVKAALDGIQWWQIGSEFILFLLATIYCIVTLVAGLLFTVSVYARYIKICIHAALAPIGLSFFAGDDTRMNGKAYIMSIAQVAMEAVIVLLTIRLLCAVISDGTLVTLVPGDGDTVILINYIIRNMFAIVLLLVMTFGANRMVSKMFGGH